MEQLFSCTLKFNSFHLFSAFYSISALKHWQVLQLFNIHQIFEILYFFQNYSINFLPISQHFKQSSGFNSAILCISATIPPFNLSPFTHFQQEMQFFSSMSCFSVCDEALLCSRPSQAHHPVRLQGLCAGAAALRGPSGRRGPPAGGLLPAAPQLRPGLLRDGNSLNPSTCFLSIYLTSIT